MTGSLVVPAMGTSGCGQVRRDGSGDPAAGGALGGALTAQTGRWAEAAGEGAGRAEPRAGRRVRRQVTGRPGGPLGASVAADARRGQAAIVRLRALRRPRPENRRTHRRRNEARCKAPASHAPAGNRQRHGPAGTVALGESRRDRPRAGPADRSSPSVTAGGAPHDPGTGHQPRGGGGGRPPLVDGRPARDHAPARRPGLLVPRRRRLDDPRHDRHRADPRARDPAGLDRRLDLPRPARPPAGDRPRRAGPQAAPLPRGVPRAPRRRRSSTG